LQVLVAGAVISAQLAKPKAKSKSKDKGKGAGAPDETSQLKCRKTRLPTQRLHPESTTCSAIVGPRTQRRGQEKGIVYGKSLHDYSQAEARKPQNRF
jgi:hypothetical protein